MHKMKDWRHVNIL